MPAWMTTPTVARSSGSSYAISCAAARSAPRSANLLALAQPAINTPIDRQARHRERVEHADVEVLDDEVGPRGQHEEHEERRQDDDGRRDREDPPVGLAPA